MRISKKPQKITAAKSHKIIVHTPDKNSGHRKQKIKIYHKTVGIINVADDERVALDGRLGMKNRRKKTT